MIWGWELVLRLPNELIEHLGGEVETTLVALARNLIMIMGAVLAAGVEAKETDNDAAAIPRNVAEKNDGNVRRSNNS